MGQNLTLEGLIFNRRGNFHRPSWAGEWYFGTKWFVFSARDFPHRRGQFGIAPAIMPSVCGKQNSKLGVSETHAHRKKELDQHLEDHQEGQRCKGHF
jgi:hypothetical protein